MTILPRRALMAIVAVVDVALHARPLPVSAKALAARHKLPPRYLESVLQALVRQGVLRGRRGPHGGYELARERRRISLGEVARIAMATDDEEPVFMRGSALLSEVIEPAVRARTEDFLKALEAVSIEHLCDRAEATLPELARPVADFAI